MTVYLQDGTPVEIDEQDAHILAEQGWIVRVQNKLNYVVRYKNKKADLLHRVILGLHGRLPFVDHRDGNGLNNKRQNLRTCTHQQNIRNQYRKPDGKSSRFKGVYLEKRKNLWKARLCVNGKRISLGLHRDEVDAAIAYNKAALRVFGEFARLNEVATWRRDHR